MKNIIIIFAVFALVGCSSGRKNSPQSIGTELHQDGSVWRNGVLIANPIPGETWVIENGQAVLRGGYSFP